MPIPPLDENGFLPPGVHDCTMADVEDCFGRFMRTDQRIRLFEKLVRYLKEVQSTGMAVALLIDGSFVTGKADPDDIDLVLVLKTVHDFTAELRPFEYNVLSRTRVRQNFRFDVLIAVEDSPDYQRHSDFFQQVRDQPQLRKGILRVAIP